MLARFAAMMPQAHAKSSHVAEPVALYDVMNLTRNVRPALEDARHTAEHLNQRHALFFGRRGRFTPADYDATPVTNGKYIQTSNA